MNKKNENIEKHLWQAAGDLTPEAAEKIWNQPVEKAEKDDWFLDGTQEKKTRRGGYYKWASLAAACFVVVILSWFQLYRMTDSVIYLDVNPSISLKLNRGETVLKAEAENHDGEVILEEMDLRGVKADVAVNALLGSMVKHGYLSQTQNAVLVSVEGENASRTDNLMQKISQDAEQTMTRLLGDGIVLYQEVDSGQQEEETARTYEITPGKAALILHLLEKDPSKDISELAGMPVTDLVRYCLLSDDDITKYLEENGGVIGNLDKLTREILDELEDSDSMEEVYEEVLEEMTESDDDADDDDLDDRDDRYDDPDDQYDDRSDNDEDARYDSDDWDDEARDDRYDDDDDDDHDDDADDDDEPDDD